MLVSADGNKMKAIRSALPQKRYEITYASPNDCLKLISEQTFLPDAVLIDSAISNAKPKPGPSGRSAGGARPPTIPGLLGAHGASGDGSGAHDGASAGGSDVLLSSVMSGLPGSDFAPPPQPLSALKLLVALRELHDPSVLSIIMLTSATAGGAGGAAGASGAPQLAMGEMVGGKAGNMLLPATGSTSGPGGEAEQDGSGGHVAAATEGVMALMHGANDYMVLPVLSVELEARINMQVGRAWCCERRWVGKQRWRQHARPRCAQRPTHDDWCCAGGPEARGEDQGRGVELDAAAPRHPARARHPQAQAGQEVHCAVPRGGERRGGP